MNKKSYALLYLFVGLSTFLVAELFYLQQTQEMTLEQQRKKSQFVTLAGLPDLALVTETSSVRHRTISDLFSIYRDDANLREYFPSTFAYSHSGIINKDSTLEN
ncbi:MAG TPA: hypothetical protein EYG90_01285 [Campylobacterales bacterium]|nr:hypothetical protein [Campylobacterales bacterium]